MIKYSKKILLHGEVHASFNFLPGKKTPQNLNPADPQGRCSHTSEQCTETSPQSVAVANTLQAHSLSSFGSKRAENQVQNNVLLLVFFHFGFILVILLLPVFCSESGNLKLAAAETTSEKKGFNFEVLVGIWICTLTSLDFFFFDTDKDGGISEQNYYHLWHICPSLCSVKNLLLFFPSVLLRGML